MISKMIKFYIDKNDMMSYDIIDEIHIRVNNKSMAGLRLTA